MDKAYFMKLTLTCIKLTLTIDIRLTLRIFEDKPFGNSTKLATRSGAIPAQLTIIF